MKKILFLINSLCGGGAEKSLVTLVNNLDKDKYEITVMTIFDEGIYKDALDEKIKYRTIIKTKNKFLKKLFAYLVCFKLSKKWVYKRLIKKKYDYDIEIAFLEGVPTKLLSVSNASKKFAWVHTDMYNYYSQEKAYKTVENAIDIYKSYSKIVLVSSVAKEGFIKRFNLEENLVVKYNAIDENEIALKSKERIELERKNRPLVVSVGRLVEQKAYDRLLRVVKKLVDDGMSLDLWLVGDGPMRPQFEEYVLDNNLRDFVKFVGFSSNPYKYMKQADIFVSSSVVEGFSLVSVEALHCENVLVLTDVGGARELLNDSQFGILVENSENGIMDGLKKVILSKDTFDFYKRKTKERAKDFRCEKSIKSIENLFEE